MKMKINNLIWYIGSCILLVYGTVILARCTSSDCFIVEYHKNGGTKLIACKASVKKDHYCYKQYYENDTLQTQFCSVGDKLEGEVVKFYESGKIKSTSNWKQNFKEGTEVEYYESGGVKLKSTYLRGKKNGDSYDFLADGRINSYSYYVDANAIYIKIYRYNSDKPSESESYQPILNFKQDTLYNIINPLEFELSFPLPDSLLSGRKLTFAYEMKPLSLRDSIILNPTNEILLNNKKPVNASLELKSPVTQIFYGHIIDKAANHIFNPVEKVIFFLPQEDF